MHLQISHRLKFVRQDTFVDVMHCRYRELVIHRIEQPDEYMTPYLCAIGFYSIAFVVFIQLD